jgi:hypothetical protein
VIGDAGEDGAGVAIQRPLSLAENERGVEQRAVDVVLILFEAPVADAHRRRPSIAAEPDAALGRPDAAVEAIQDVDLRLGERRRLHEPPEQRPRLAVAPSRISALIMKFESRIQQKR